MYDDEPYGIDDEYISTSDLNEQIYYEKLDADMEMAQLEEAGRRYYAKQLQVNKLINAGDYLQAAMLCTHGHIGKLSGTCSLEDPRYGELGYRCYECGAVVTDMGGTVIHTR